MTRILLLALASALFLSASAAGQRVQTWEDALAAVPATPGDAPDRVHLVVSYRHPSARSLPTLVPCGQHAHPDSVALISGQNARGARVFRFFREPGAASSAVAPIPLPHGADTLRAQVVGILCQNPGGAPAVMHLRTGGDHLIYDAGREVGWYSGDETFPLLHGIMPGMLSPLMWEGRNLRFAMRDRFRATDWEHALAAAPVPAHGPRAEMAELTGRGSRTPHSSTRAIGYIRPCSHPAPDSLALVSGTAPDTPRVYVAYRDSATAAVGIKQLAIPERPDTLRAQVVGLFCGDRSLVPRFFHLRAGRLDLFYDAYVSALGYSREAEDYPHLYGRQPDGSLSQMVLSPARRLETRENGEPWYQRNLEAAVRRRTSGGVTRPIATAIVQQRVMVGMTPAQVRESIGDPDRINRYGTTEQWVYGRLYVYVEAGRVRSTDSIGR